jgi:hypothetical protein
MIWRLRQASRKKNCYKLTAIVEAHTAFNAKNKLTSNNGRKMHKKKKLFIASVEVW